MVFNLLEGIHMLYMYIIQIHFYFLRPSSFFNITLLEIFVTLLGKLGDWKGPKETAK
jgi:hypothetical protein